LGLTLLLVLAFREISWGEVFHLVRTARWRWLAAAVAANAVILPLAAYQWMRFLPEAKPVPFRAMLWLTTVTSTVSNGGPFMAGHAVGVQLLATRPGVGYAAAVSVKVLDQLAEGLAKLAVLALALSLAPMPAAYRTAALALVALLPTAALAVGFAAHRRASVARMAGDLPGWKGRVVGFLADVATQLESLRRPWLFAQGVGLALLQKVAEGAALLAVLTAVGIPVPVWGLLAVLAAVNLSTMASVTVANVGVYEASAVAAYRLVGLDFDTAVAVATLQHAAYLVPMAGAGWIAMAATGLGIRLPRLGEAGEGGRR
jgi:uncharacterized membrane protein YbhN (UPF0104 family)